MGGGQHVPGDLVHRPMTLAWIQLIAMQPPVTMSVSLECPP